MMTARLAGTDGISRPEERCARMARKPRARVLTEAVPLPLNEGPGGYDVDDAPQEEE
jgi:hypothetical protein